MESEPRVGIKLTVHSPDYERIISSPYQVEGNFSFTSQDDGEYVICLQSNTTTGWFSGNKKHGIHFDKQVGALAVDYAALMHKEKLTHLQLRVRQLMNQIMQIAK